MLETGNRFCWGLGVDPKQQVKDKMKSEASVYYYIFKNDSKIQIYITNICHFIFTYYFLLHYYFT